MSELSEKEIIKSIENTLKYKNEVNLAPFKVQVVQGLLDLYQKEKEKNNNLIHELRIYQNETISKNEISEKIEEIIQNSSKFNCLSPLNYNDEYNATRYAVTKLEELLQEGDK